jgi:hypothetical protein
MARDATADLLPITTLSVNVIHYQTIRETKEACTPHLFTKDDANQQRG